MPRSVAFSGKKRKEQLKAKKQKKQLIESGPETRPHDRTSLLAGVLMKGGVGGGDGCVIGGSIGGVNFLQEVEAVNCQPKGSGNTNRYNLKFRKETDEEKTRRRAAHHIEILSQPPKVLERGSEAFYPPGLRYPTRPPWRLNMSKRELDASENRHFRLFCEALDREFGEEGQLSLYELNLETWRQLWRVTEMADVILIIVDARFPSALFPPYLYDHLVKEEGRGIIVVMNKCDLVNAGVVAAWHHYFTTHYPAVTMVPFSSWESQTRTARKQRMATQSSLRLVHACQNLVREEVDLSSWVKKIEEEGAMPFDDDEGSCLVEEEEVPTGDGGVAPSTRPQSQQRYQDGILTIATVGHPNVGKSSLINALMGRKVVSVSKTPGHTKHFQTIFLTKTVRLCDCPGLVFPSTITKPLQVVLGSYPISQVRDPISVVQYIAARVDMPTILKLKHPSDSDDEERERKWTAYYICEAWAMKRGYTLRKRSGPDVFRAANELLRLCLNGQRGLVLCLTPPGYNDNRGTFDRDPITEIIRSIQGVHAADPVEAESRRREEGGSDAESQETDDSEDDGSDDDDDDDSEDERGKTNMQNKFALLTEND